MSLIRKLLIVPMLANLYYLLLIIKNAIDPFRCYGISLKTVRYLFKHYQGLVFDLIFLTISLVLIVIVFIKIGPRAAANAPDSINREPNAVVNRKDPMALSKIRAIAALHKMGALSDEEFSQKKAELLQKL